MSNLSSVDTLEKPPQTSKPVVSRRMPRLLTFKSRPAGTKITLNDVEEIATLCGKGLCESEACAVLGINYQSWRQFKLRHKETLEYAFHTVRSAQLLGHIEIIEKAQTRDWRAADRLLQLKAPERFGPKQDTNVQVAVVGEGVLVSALEKVYGKASTEAKPLAPGKVNQLLADSTSGGSLSPDSGITDGKPPIDV